VSVRLSGQRPGADRDGLQALAVKLTEDATADLATEVTIVAVVRTREVVHRLDPDHEDPVVVVVELVDVEPLTGKAAATARGHLARAFEARTGKRRLFAPGS